MKMEVTVNQYNKGNLAGYANIVFDDRFAIEHVQIKKHKDNGLYVEMPTVQKRDGELKELFHPISAKARLDLDKSIIEAYENARKGQKSTEFKDDSPPIRVSAVSSAQYENKNMIGFANVRLSNNCVVEGIQIKVGKNGEYLDMPKYRHLITQNGSPVFENGMPKVEYNSVFKPITKDSAAELKKAVVNDFNRRYNQQKNIVRGQPVNKSVAMKI